MREPTRYALLVVAGWVVLVVAMTMSAGGDEPVLASSGIVALAGRERALTTTGKLRDVDVDAPSVVIAEAPPLGRIEEHPVPRIAEPPLHPAGTIDRGVLKREVEDRFKDLELCRARVARAARVPWEELEAGAVELRWVILPSGLTQDTLVLERAPTDLAVMKCVRRRMDAWRFTPPANGPVSVKYAYSFFAPAGKS